jgi:hypothetical protein
LRVRSVVFSLWSGLVLLAVALGGPAAAAEPEATARVSEFVTTVATIERVPLPKLRGPAEVRVDSLRSTVIITAPRDLGAVAAKVSSGLGSLCPRWEVDGGRILLRCRTRQLHAAIVEERGKKYLDLQELRGLPHAAEEDRLYVFYDPVKAGLGGPCPGTVPAARGECLLKDGDKAGAAAAFKESYTVSFRALASLRLGDLAAEEGDFAEAAVWWTRAGSAGPFGRLARGRLCELRGDCLNGSTSIIFDAGEIAEPMRTELALRAARIDLYGGRMGLALRWIASTIKRWPTSGGCLTVGRLYCRRLVLAGLEDPDRERGKEALDIYLALPDRLTGPLAAELAKAAGEKAAVFGAPVFGANLHAAVTGLIPAREVPAHLLRIVELYLAGDDRARAQLVVDYAESRLEAKELSAPRWVSVRKRLTGPTISEIERARKERIEREIISAEAARDVADAVRLLARSKAELP